MLKANPAGAAPATGRLLAVGRGGQQHLNPRRTRSGSPAPNRRTSNEVSMGQANWPRLQLYPKGRWGPVHHAGIETAHAPTRRRGVQRFDPLVIDYAAQRLPINIQCRTRPARLGDFEERAAGAKPVSDPQPAHVNPSHGEVLAMAPKKTGYPVLLQFLHNLGSDQQQSLARSAMNLRCAWRSPSIPRAVQKLPEPTFREPPGETLTCTMVPCIRAPPSRRLFHAVAPAESRRQPGLAAHGKLDVVIQRKLVGMRRNLTASASFLRLYSM